MRGSSILTIVLFLAALVPGPGVAEPPQCRVQPPSSRVSILVVASPERVAGYAASVTGTKLLHRSRKTVIFADGRVVTTDLGATSALLNQLGWAGRRIEIVGSFPRRRARRAAT